MILPTPGHRLFTILPDRADAAKSSIEFQSMPPYQPCRYQYSCSYSYVHPTCPKPVPVCISVCSITASTPCCSGLPCLTSVLSFLIFSLISLYFSLFCLPLSSRNMFIRTCTLCRSNYRTLLCRSHACLQCRCTLHFLTQPSCFSLCRWTPSLVGPRRSINLASPCHCHPLSPLTPLFFFLVVFSF